MTARRVALPLAVLLLAAGPALAQRGRTDPPRPTFTVIAGPSIYDLSGTGTAGFAAIRVDVPAGRVFVIEPGLGVFRYTAQTDETLTYLFPEVSFQAQVPGGGVRPYVGGGIGFTEFLSGRGRTDVTLHAAAGLRVALAGGWGLRGEARLRSVDPFTGNTFDLGFGVSRALRP